MTEEPRLDLETTYQAIRKAALEHRFISYGDLAEANNVPWIKARRAIPQQLGQLVTLAHERGWPMPSAIVVNKENVESGTLEGSARDGFIAAARDIGLTIADPAQFVKEQQQKVFAWAKTAPETLGLVPGEQDATAKTGPRFIQYFGSVLNALRDVGGEAKPKDVIDWIISHEKVPETILKATTKGGHSRFENQVGWARFYLVKAGLIDDRKRGIWALTPEGRDTRLTHESALEIFKDVRAQGWGDDDDNTPVPPTSDNAAELFADTARQFWFVGAAWDEGDQADRFLTEGVWQNGYDEKFTDLVRTMRPGDRIAIKSSFVRKHKLPFNAGGKSVSCMRIKAIGTIIENPGDGKTVRVDWTTVDPPRDWFFYTYRTTIIQADSNDDLARRLILFTFADAPQDYQFWLQVPYFARKYGASSQTATLEKVFVDNDDDEAEAAAAAAEAPTYSADNIAADGCFLPRAAIDGALDRLKDKLNIILQGPPGTGKTWLARRLAYALIGSKDRKVTQARMRVVQFHPSLSYEDFVRGWRPTAGAKLELVDGIFLKAVQAASAEPDLPFVLIIEEINRGNPAQVFGEMLTLLEDTKRQQDEALELAYSREGEKPIHIPRNLHVIGTMNIADRSLALVDLALRRRFAFITLEPQLGPLWRAWCTGKAGLDAQVIDLIEQRITALNTEIAGDRSLGPQFRIGHSFVTPREGAIIANGKAWFSQIVETEIAPLLEEYWYDAVVKATEAKRHLLAGLT